VEADCFGYEEACYDANCEHKHRNERDYGALAETLGLVDVCRDNGQGSSDDDVDILAMTAARIPMHAAV
jgi:hypothetical protein